MFAKAFLLLLCGGFACQAFSQPITWIHGARTAALANADAALQGPWNTIGNPAGIAGCRSPAISFALERRFLMKELDTRALTTVIPFKKQVFGLNINFFGSGLYNEHLVSLCYARALSPEFSAGFRINYHGIKLPGYTSQQAWSVTAGVQAALRSGLRLGAAISNPGRAAFNDELYAEIPLIASLGAAYSFSEKVLAAFELESISGFPVTVNTGLEYFPHPHLALRCGISSSPFRQYGGLGIRYKGLALDLSASSHRQLGFTPQITLSYVF
ncbi:hypothetical protein EDD80_105136 [Anseongella ginsenosidimutans]|uniref:Outer membrane protein with beta-barrel domain n=1 Tax=Anseongella ginsenosidimutans TaxID=496056 RepID=A0A4R3KQW8_9SPHI|nr:hypothetical protein [Anseongella ginsenosidimutans]QEC52929.1 hypothetical protein FRZ59_11670 [Anseongella ginsenosidimutans]TCS87322.1 hypothetical protein EDD80_105136 [Anseongella ginsenosidimutans]